MARAAVLEGIVFAALGILALWLSVLYGGGYQVFGLDLPQIVAVQVRNGKIAEDIVQNACGHLDIVMALDDAVRFEFRKSEGIDVLVQRHTVL
jgi:hypothetical protein